MTQNRHRRRSLSLYGVSGVLGVRIFGVISLCLVCSVVSAEVKSDGTCEELHSVWVETKKGGTFNLKQDTIKVSEALKLFEVGAYLGYIMGWIDRDDSINLPIDEAPDEYLTIVGNWLERHPEKWHEHPSDCVFWALEEAFGLKK